MEATRRKLLRPLDEYEPPARTVDVNELLVEMPLAKYPVLSNDSED